MNWILVAVILLLVHKECMTSPSPLKLPENLQKLSPYIRHWEAAKFDRTQLLNAHQKHIEQKRHRRKRDLNSGEYGPSHTIKLNFFAHDREFRLVLRQDPLSVFAPDAEIENTLGPMDYDISRIYTGSLEDDESSHVHAILTSDNHLDGTIETSSEQFYIEPSHRYSRDLPRTGIHSIVYKLSDVNMQKAMPETKLASMESCASERLRRSMLFDDMKRRKTTTKFTSKMGERKKAAGRTVQDETTNHRNVVSKKQSIDESSSMRTATASKFHTKTEENPHSRRPENDVSISHNRRKRWLPDELSPSNDHQNPPLPLDLDVPYNDDISVYTSNMNNDGSMTTATTTTTTTPQNNNDDLSLTIFDKQPLHRERIPPSAAEEEDEEDDEVDEEKEAEEQQQNQASVITWRTNAASTVTNNNNNNNNNNKNIDNQNLYQAAVGSGSANSRNRNIIGSNYQDDSRHSNNRSNNVFNPNNSYKIGRKTYTKHKNIIVSSYNRTILSSDEDMSTDSSSGGGDSNNFINNFFNTNWSTMFTERDRSASSRPSHKTHVEIITKNGATKKPNIIVNNYNPDIVLTTNNQNPYNSMSMMMSNAGPARQDNNVLDANSATRAMYDRKITCMLYLQGDHTFFQKMGSDESSIEAITRHVQRANSIYRNTDFNNDGKPDNITFMIKRIKVHNAHALKDPGYRFPGNYGVEKFLELFSEEDYDAFCLAYMFTYRDFEMGTLGLAWTGDLKNAGGVCEKNGHYRGSLKSLNTGIVTLLNYGKHVPPAVSHVTLAHEIGHNFGSPHDPEQCTPGGEDGNYIMFARATSGDKRNNNKFSPCSLKSIEPVLNAKARSVKGCFTEPQTSICGNGVVEPGEQCDCGWEEDCKDSCCFAMSRHPRLDEKPCTLTPRAMCSPSQGPCCTTDCKLKFGDKCRDDNGCRDPSFCDGRMPQCPPSVNRPNKTICNKEFVCYMGDCTGSICLAYGLESCQCLPGPNDPKTKSCELCCKQPGEGNPCRSSFDWNEPPYDVPDMFAKPGTPCNDYNGYCDVSQKCRDVDPSGPLATLRKLLLSEENIATFKKWMQTNWYTVVFAAVGVLILLILSTKLLAKRSNLKLKSVTIIHSATTETVRLPDDNNGVIVHTAVRTKVPFKKKVRGERPSAKTKIINNKCGNTAAAAAAGHKPIATAHQRQQQQLLQNVIRSKSDHLKKAPPGRKKNRITVPPALHGAGALTSPDDHQQQQQQQQQKPIDGKKMSKKSKQSKHSKEIIDYSNRNGGGIGSNGGHTNTFGKVHKWLLESPIVSQPLSHIEHSSKVRKVISKSQSTPERLVQKSPQKTKSVGNLSNEKVKLQVVYKPPFKFSLRLSKNSKVKTHVVGSGAAAAGPLNMKGKRRTRPVGDGKRNVTAQEQSANKVSGERMKRAALLLRTNAAEAEDSQKLTPADEPNYETLNPKATGPSLLDSPLYENMQYSQVSEDRSSSNKSSSKMNRSSSKTNLDAMMNSSQPPPPPPLSYSRSNSISTNNPFSVASKQSNCSRKFSDSNSINLSRNFGSTQNLIQSSQANLVKSKKRSSLNLKSSGTAAVAVKSPTNRETSPPPPQLPQPAPPPATKRSISNLNLRHENSASNLRRDDKNSTAAAVVVPSPSSSLSSSVQEQQQQPPLRRSSSNSTANHHHQLLLRSSRASFGNIPRASLSATNVVTPSSCTPPAAATAAAAGSSSFSNFSNHPISFSRQSPPTAAPPPLPPTTTTTATATSSPTSTTTTTAPCDDPKRMQPPSPFGGYQLQQSSSGSHSSSSNYHHHHHHHHHHHQQQQHQHSSNNNNGNLNNHRRSNRIGSAGHNQLSTVVVGGPQRSKQMPPTPALHHQQELPSDLEVMVSDVKNLVS